MIKKMMTLFLTTFLILQSGLVLAIIPIPTDPVITWENPDTITWGTALSAIQLNATSSVEGTFAYTPAVGTVLEAGTHELTSIFIPQNSVSYNTVYDTVNITVLKEPMQLTIKTTGDGQSIELPLVGTVNVTVDWGDNVIEKVTSSGFKEHTFATAGTYTVEIRGELSTFGYFNKAWSGVDYLTAVNSFGDLGLTSISYAFNGADSLNYVPDSLPATITSLRATFMAIGMVEIENLDKWDVSHVTDMTNLFWNAKRFNQDISDWDVSHVTNMTYMFYRAFAFNQDIDNWKVDSVTTMIALFAECSAFNQDLNSWNVSKVTDMEKMFSYATAFNGNISSWNTENVNSMSYMFKAAGAFDQDISAWDVKNVTDMSGMFYGCTMFNQDISSWNVAKVTDMSNMFAMAHAFNQDIGAWDIDIVTDMSDMFNYVTLPVATYDSILIGFAAQEVQSGVTFNGGDGKYSSKAAAARDTLIAHNWIITDGGALELPVITWDNPEDIVSGTALSVIQLNATSSVAGVFEYSAAIDSVLIAGSNQMITAIFTPDETSLYETVSDTVYINVTVATAGVGVSDESLELVMYPNPSHQMVNVKLQGVVAENVQLTVLDLSGKAVMNRKYSVEDEISFSVAQQASGIYFVQCICGDVKLVKKLIVN